MTKEQEALKLALEALESDNPDIQLRAAITLRLAIEQARSTPVQEPVKDRLDFWALFDENQRLRAELKFNTTPPAAQPAPVQESQKHFTKLE